MSFHFQPQADSSDEEEAVDISAWKSGASKPVQEQPTSPPKAALEMMDELANEIGDDGDGDEIGTFQGDLNGDVPEAAEGQEPEAKEDQVSFVSSGFTSVNKPAPTQAPVTLPESSEDEQPTPSRLELPTRTRRAASKPAVAEKSTARVLVPVIPRLDLDSSEADEIIDYTAGNDVVRRVKKELKPRRGDNIYVVEFEDRHVEQVPFEELLRYDNGQSALDDFESGPTPDSTPEPAPSKSRKSSHKMSSTRPRSKRQLYGYVNTVDAVSDGEAASDDSGFDDSRGPRGRKRKLAFQSQYVDEPEESDDDGDEQSDEEESTSRLRRAGRRLVLRNSGVNQRSLRGSKHPVYASEFQDDADSSDEIPFLDSDLTGTKRRRTKIRGRGAGRNARDSDDDIAFNLRPVRASGRSTRHQGAMAEVGEDNIYLNEADLPAVAPAKPKALGAREVFKSLPRNDEFRMRHIQDCETCGQGANFGVLIHCQGCVLTYHKGCIGHRTNREHLVTKVRIPKERISKVADDGTLEPETESFSVLQCRRCVANAKSKDATAPDQGKCADCHDHGNACLSFRPRKTPMQEQKERDDNDGEDPASDIDPSRINQADNVLFRCLSCWRAFHFEHLPSRNDIMDMDTEVDVEQRWREYSRDWKCKDCVSMPAKVSGLIAWKPVDEDTYDPVQPVDAIEEDEKAYLVKWEGMSYFRARWMSGPWVWGVTAPSMRKAFAKREDSQHPKLRTEDAIPEDYLRTDIVLDIRFTSIVDIRTEEIDKARIREVDKALIKYKGLGYEDAVWETPPSPDDGERWTDFVTAYNDWVLGRYVKPQRPSLLKTKLEKARAQDFAKLEKHEQPDNVEGGNLMNYQIEGLNWLYYKWFTQKNCILADEMGLGKTIQIIAFLATLVADWNCFPFLVVVPNSTCPNWRREVKRWAPSLRVVAYYGSRESRELAYKHELFPENSKELRCHIVVTSYDTASDDRSLRFFKSVNWQGLIVDEGQRLKNDKNLLYSALGQLKAPFRILLTGTPLQNNQRELFNLLHFLDDTYNAAQLEKDYEELDANKIGELHEMIRPFFLRRTKAQVLTFLPPIAQIIVPVSMTIVQKKVYRTILAKNPELMKAIFSSESTPKQAERASLSNILIQLRKCLCHPFVYNKSIEERNVNYTTSHRNLVDASAKLKMLELLLPKLQERGHRVLIFSQFLDMLDIVEDFLDGMQFKYQRLDGSIGTLQKQKRIDEFNAPDSPLFVFLLSTRAGGVGINLASADTVIILDPDFNPHQDIQALSRAHRIGQSKKVLCFQLVTRASAEERIMQMGRKKLALDHVLIQEMDADDADQNDLVSVLRHGANELFEDNGGQDITYDSSSVERLLDRSHMEDTKAGEDKSAETQFSFARVWANDRGTLQEDIVEEGPEEQAPDPNVWASILRERERLAAEEASAKAEAYGRGRRARGAIDYGNELEAVEGLEITPIKKRVKKNGDESDTDFQDDDSGPDEDENEDGEALEVDDIGIVDGDAKLNPGRKQNAPIFKRALIPQNKYIRSGYSVPQNEPGIIVIDDGINCMACRMFHPQGECPLKIAGVEYCNLCGMAHFGAARVCPHIQSETQVRQMLEALKHSTEPEHIIAEAKRYLRGLKGNLVQLKKQKEAKTHAAREAQLQEHYQRARAPLWQP